MIHENICQKFEKQRSNAELPMPEIQAWILEQLARYFIIIVSSFLLFIALNGQVVGYKIIYMLFFLFSGVIFQLSWNMWHRVLRVFWLLLVVYSILVWFRQSVAKKQTARQVMEAVRRFKSRQVFRQADFETGKLDRLLRQETGPQTGF